MSIETILAMLARGNSDSEAEGIHSIESAYKRMQKEGVTIFDLLERSKEDLYQNSMNRLADVIAKLEHPNEPNKQRDTYAKLSYLIAQKFIPEGAKQSKSSEQGSTDSSSRADEAQKAYDEARKRKAQEESVKPERPEPKETPTEEAMDTPTIRMTPMYTHFLILNRHYLKNGLLHDLAHDLKNTLLLFSAGISFGYVCCFFIGIIFSATKFLPSPSVQIMSGIALYVGATSAINFGLWKHRNYQ
jgi:hypothetical protein